MACSTSPSFPAFVLCIGVGGPVHAHACGRSVLAQVSSPIAFTSFAETELRTDPLASLAGYQGLTIPHLCLSALELQAFYMGSKDVNSAHVLQNHFTNPHLPSASSTQ